MIQHSVLENQTPQPIISPTMLPLRVLVCGGREFGRIRPYERLRYLSNIMRPLELEEFLKRKEQYHFVLSTLEMVANEYHKVINEWEDAYGNWLPHWFIISGGASGVDDIAIDWAVVNWCEFKEYPADWKKYKKAAGFRRNQQMLDEGRPDLVIAFPGGNGTAHMVKIAKDAGVPVREIIYLAE